MFTTDELEVDPGIPENNKQQSMTNKVMSKVIKRHDFIRFIKQDLHE